MKNAVWTLKGKKILIIDDLPGMRSMLRAMLNSYEAALIVEATNGEDAVEKMSENIFDIVLCDYNLGEGKNGQQVLEEAKDLDLLPYSTVYIMTTAENTSAMVMGAIEYKPDDYLSKPFTKQALIARLKTLVNKKNSLKKIASAMYQRNYKLAKSLCEQQLTEENGNKLELTKIMADLCLKLKQYPEAEAIYKSVLEERDLPWAKLGLGQSFFHRNMLDEAKTIFTEIIEETPTYVFAHDWLAKTYNLTGDTKKSQEIIQQAIEKSPMAILRQKELVDIAIANEDYKIAETASKKVIRIGKNSCYQSPDDYNKLANVYLKTGKELDAVKMLGKMRQEFKGKKHETRISALIHEASLYHGLKRENDVKKTLREILKLFGRKPGILTSDDAMTLAEICFDLGMKTEGDLLMRHVVRNNHDNPEYLDKVKAFLEKTGTGAEAKDLISSTKNEVIALNNEGVEYVTNGNIADSISLFVKAATSMPENQVINLNASQSLIMHMQKSGVSDELLAQTKTYLSRIKFDGDPSEKYLKLLTAYSKLCA